MVPDEEFNRMRWAARRGMLELDLMLEPFVTACYCELGDTDRQRFQQLMLCEDQDLFSWFMQRGEPEDEELIAIVRKIIIFARTAPEDR